MFTDVLKGFAILIAASGISACGLFAGEGASNSTVKEFNECNSFYAPGPGNKPIATWLVAHVKGVIPPEWNVENPWPLLRSQFSEAAGKCLLNTRNGLLTGDYRQKTFLEKLNALLTWVVELKKGDADSSINSRLLDNAFRLKRDNISTLSGPAVTTINTVNGICSQLKNQHVDLENKFELLNAVQDTHLQASVLAEFCSETNRDKIDGLASRCEETLDGSCDLLDLYDAVQRCKDFSSGPSNTDGHVGIPEIIEQMKEFKDRLVSAAQKCADHASKLSATWDQLKSE